MSIAHLLDDFGEASSDDVVELSELKLEEERLEAFEKGYQAGWDDSAAAGHSETDDATRRISQRLNDLSFTYHEAYAGALKALGPVIRQLVDAVLPKMARRMIGPQIHALLQDLLAEHGRQPVILKCASEDRPALETIRADASALPLQIIEDPSLTPGQVEIRFGEATECELDLNEVISGVSGALDAFFETPQQDHKESA